MRKNKSPQMKIRRKDRDNKKKQKTDADKGICQSAAL
jgi:hypothetical protein